jgi:hypothetical protein
VRDAGNPSVQHSLVDRRNAVAMNGEIETFELVAGPVESANDRTA